MKYNNSKIPQKHLPLGPTLCKFSPENRPPCAPNKLWGLSNTHEVCLTHIRASACLAGETRCIVCAEAFPKVKRDYPRSTNDRRLLRGTLANAHDNIPYPSCCICTRKKLYFLGLLTPPPQSTPITIQSCARSTLTCCSYTFSHRSFRRSLFGCRQIQGAGHFEQRLAAGAQEQDPGTTAGHVRRRYV